LVFGNPESNSFVIIISCNIYLIFARVCLETRDISKKMEREGKGPPWTLGNTGSTKVVLKE
jgi:hypothetical protein